MFDYGLSTSIAVKQGKRNATSQQFLHRRSFLSLRIFVFQLFPRDFQACNRRFAVTLPKRHPWRKKKAVISKSQLSFFHKVINYYFQNRKAFTLTIRRKLAYIHRFSNGIFSIYSQEGKF